jgi:hypothetical protein
MARGLHGHNAYAEISPKALSRLNFQVKQSEKFGLSRIVPGPVEIGTAGGIAPVDVELAKEALPALSH